MKDETNGGIVTRRARGAGLSIGADEPAAGGRRSSPAAEEPAAEGFAAPRPLIDLGAGAARSLAGGRTAKRARLAFEELPLIWAACDEHEGAIAGEGREDAIALVSTSTMLTDGDLLVKLVDDGPNDPRGRFRMTEDAFGALVTRLGLPAAARYLRACWPELRAANLNGWIDRHIMAEARATAAAEAAARASQYAPLDMRIRHRAIAGDPLGTREIFAVVGAGYADLDADKIDTIVRSATTGSDRGRVTYDGRRTRWELLTTGSCLRVEDVPGSWRAGAVITTDDAGGGAVSGGAIVRDDDSSWILGIRSATFSVRHVGDLEAVARKVRAGLDAVSGAVRPFVVAMGQAVGDRPSCPHGPAGIFRDLIVRGLLPVRGEREAAIAELVAAWRRSVAIGDRAAMRPSRLSIVLAIARWTVEDADLDPWGEDEVQAAAGALLRRTAKGDGWAVRLGSIAAEDA